jgi:hypothetical protein
LKKEIKNNKKKFAHFILTFYLLISNMLFSKMSGLILNNDPSVLNIKLNVCSLSSVIIQFYQQKKFNSFDNPPDSFLLASN